MADINDGREGLALVERLDVQGVLAAADELADVLVDCVAGGASVSFMAGLDLERASAYWRAVGQGMEDGRCVFVARRREDGRIVGTVQVLPVQIENQPHRAEIAKMLVLRTARRRGVGAALVRAAEAAAAAMGRTLLVLDTASEDAARLYESLGWTFVGAIPDFALLPDGRPAPTRIYYKDLS